MIELTFPCCPSCLFPRLASDISSRAALAARRRTRSFSSLVHSFSRLSTTCCTASSCLHSFHCVFSLSTRTRSSWFLLSACATVALNSLASTDARLNLCSRLATLCRSCRFLYCSVLSIRCRRPSRTILTRSSRWSPSHPTISPTFSSTQIFSCTVETTLSFSN